MTEFEVQYWTGAAWAAVPGGGVSGNDRVWRRVTFPPVTTTKVRVLVTGALDGYSRVTELEAWGPEGRGGGASINWLVTDHLGTPRMVADQTGALAGVSRHDYLPFGEEIGAGVGGRTTAQGYSQFNGVRQRFTGHERDDETGLDFMQARFYSSVQGRFTSPDPLLSSGIIYDPQTWNRYSYVLNNPLKYIDPLGLYTFHKSVTEDQRKQFNEALSQARKNLEKIAEKYGTDSDQYKKASRALDVYGKEGVNNGVLILAQEGIGDGRASVEGVRGSMTKDNPTGQNIRVAFDPGTFKSNNALVQGIAHEGRHAADGSDWVKSGFARSSNPTEYQHEFDGYVVQSLFAEAQNASTLTLTLPAASAGKGKAPYALQFVDVWNSGWKEADKATLRKANIDRFLARPKKAGGTYGLTPTNPKQAFLKGARF